MGYQGFEELEVWKRARELKNEIGKLVKKFPPSERYLLSDQLIRSSRSVNSQLAEGHGRRTWPDKLRFSIIARGSLSETLNHLIDALDEGYIDEEVLNYYKKRISTVEKLLNGYIIFLDRQSKNGRPG